MFRFKAIGAIVGLLLVSFSISAETIEISKRTFSASYIFSGANSRSSYRYDNSSSHIVSGALLRSRFPECIAILR